MAHPPIEDDPRLTAYALGESDDSERAEIEARLADDAEARRFVEDVRQLSQLLTEDLRKEPSPGLAPDQRQAIQQRLRPVTTRFAFPRWRVYGIAAALVIGLGSLAVIALQRNRVLMEVAQLDEPRDMATPPAMAPAPVASDEVGTVSIPRAEGVSSEPRVYQSLSTRSAGETVSADGYGGGLEQAAGVAQAPTSGPMTTAPGEMAGGYAGRGPTRGGGGTRQEPPGGRIVAAPADPITPPSTTFTPATSGLAAETLSLVPARGAVTSNEAPPVERRRGQALDVSPARDRSATLEGSLSEGKRQEAEEPLLQVQQAEAPPPPADFNREAFQPIVENPFLKVSDAPLSTFGIDVDTAAYANIRRFLLNEDRLPPRDAVRIEEMVNYFSYEYDPPQNEHPFAVHVEFARCPWQPEHRLVRVGLKGKEVPLDQRPASNLVFLVDVSGSMRDYNKLPWVKESLRMLVDKLQENDRVAIVVYASARGVALAPTTGDRKGVILAAIDQMEAGGSTNGGQGLRLAYDLAQREFVAGGINRIILCTDGDFNTGDVTDLGAVTRLAEEKRATKVKLTVLGFGQGNLQDDKLEALANKGDGQYAYIDSLKEAHRVLVEQMSGTLQTIAKDVKLQLEFNPRFVEAYRLIGYENRMLRAQDFRDDTKDAGDIGAGHTVTALYELVPPGQERNVPGVDPLRFQVPPRPKDDEASRDQTLVVKLRYKAPDGDVSTPFDVSARDDGRDYADASTDFKFAAAVAEFGLLLRGSAFQGQATYDAVLELAGASLGPDPKGDRKELLDLVRRARDLSRR